jgi:uncharacterized protein
MVLPAFNSEILKNRLTKLDKNRQLAFGAVCCERLLPNYLAFKEDTGWGDINPIRESLNLIWFVLQGQQPNTQEIKKLIDACEKVGPDSEDFESLYVSSAQDACFAVCGLLDYMLKADVGKIVQAACYGTDSVDLYVQEIENIAPNDPDLEQKILTHDLMQRELEKQDKDLTLIEQIDLLSPDFLEQLKNSWDNNGRSNLDLP